MVDPIADMIIRIKNAYLAKHEQVDIPKSSLKLLIAQKLSQLGYLGTVSLSTERPGFITARLVYKNRLPVITSIKRVSKPGRRVYTGRRHLPVTLSGYGSTIISTSKGVLTDKEARQQGVGGEIICKIW